MDEQKLAAVGALLDRRVRPHVPAAVVAAIQAYGDARADDDGASGEKLRAVIDAARLWAEEIAGREPR